jgi:hypothetical protein
VYTLLRYKLFYYYMQEKKNCYTDTFFHASRAALNLFALNAEKSIQRKVNVEKVYWRDAGNVCYEQRWGTLKFLYTEIYSNI